MLTTLTTPASGADLSAERVKAQDDLPHILFLVQINCLEEIRFRQPVLFTCGQKVVDIFHLLEWYFHFVNFSTAGAHDLISQSEQQHKQ